MDLSSKAYVLIHDPDAPSRFTIRLVGSGRTSIDMLPERESGDAIGHGKTLAAASTKALWALAGQDVKRPQKPPPLKPQMRKEGQTERGFWR